MAVYNRLLSCAGEAPPIRVGMERGRRALEAGCPRRRPKVDPSGSFGRGVIQVSAGLSTTTFFHGDLHAGSRKRREVGVFLSDAITPAAGA